MVILKPSKEQGVRFMEYTDTSPSTGRVYTFRPRAGKNIILSMEYRMTFATSGVGSSTMTVSLINPNSNPGALINALDITSRMSGSDNESSNTGWVRLSPSVSHGGAGKGVYAVDYTVGALQEMDQTPELINKTSYDVRMAWTNGTNTINVTKFELRIAWIEGYIQEDEEDLISTT